MLTVLKRFASRQTVRYCSRKSNIKNLLENASSFNDLKSEQPEQEWATLPYPEGVKLRKQGEYFITKKPQEDPKNTTIILFPGQGNQYVGMAKNLMKYPMAKELFELANYVLNYDLLKLCLEGPQSQLDRTEHCQLATVVTSLAALERLKEERPNAIENCVATAGFSLGEITALIFSGAIQFEQGLKLVRVRAHAMQMACDETPGGMVTVLYGPDSRLEYACLRAKEWCVERGIEDPECAIANYMYPHCKVVGGNLEALNFLEKNAKEFKLRRIKRLPVNGAFHTKLMESAVAPFREALKKIKIEDPIIRVYSNVDGKRYRDTAHILKQLPKQIVKPVKWEQLLHVLYERDVGTNFPRTFECGPGSSLKPILKQVNAKAWDHCFSIEG